MRKALLSIVCGVAVVTAAAFHDGNAAPPVPGAASASARIAGPDVVRQLEHITADLRRTNGRLADLNAGFSSPPDGDKPAVQAALNDLKAQANELLRTATEIELKLSR